MHPKNHPPIYVPDTYVPELERLTKAALMDLVWDMAATLVPDDTRTHDIIAEIRSRAAHVVTYREQQL